MGEVTVALHKTPLIFPTLRSKEACSSKCSTTAFEEQTPLHNSNCDQQMTQVDKGVYVPLIIAAGGGGRGYNSQSQTQLEQMDYDPNQLGRNGKSHAAGTLYTALMWVCWNHLYVRAAHYWRHHLREC